MTTPAGWYDDGQGSRRWWDGSRWTDDTREPDAVVTSNRDEPAATPVPDAATALGVDGSPAQPPRRSRWWIWLVAAGALLVVLVVLAVVFIPMALRAITGGGTGPDSADERAAEVVVQTYDRAWQSADCDLMISVTTEGFRQDADLTDCAVFEEQARGLAESTSDYRVTVTSVETQEDGTIVIMTTESFVSRFDDEGNDTGSEQTYSDDYAYLVVPVEDDWFIDASELE